MNLRDLYTKQLDIFDLVKILIFYKKFIIFFFLIVQIVIITFIVYSNLNGEKSFFYKKGKFNIYTYPRIKSENIDFLLPDIDVYNELIKKLDYLPEEIKSQYQTKGGQLSFEAVEQIMNVTNIINLFDLFLKFEDLSNIKNKFQNYNLMRKTFKTYFIEMPDSNLMSASGVTIETVGETDKDLISFTKIKTEKAYQRLVQHIRKEFNRIIDQIKMENNIIEKNYIQAITRRIDFLESQSKIAKERKIYNPVIDSLGLTTFEYYKGVEILESEIMSLTRSLQDLKYIPEIQFNFRVIELITNSELYLLLSDENLSTNNKILLYDYSDIEIQTNFDLKFVNLFIYGILFSILFIFFIIIIHYSYHRYKFLSNK